MPETSLKLRVKSSRTARCPRRAEALKVLGDKIEALGVCAIGVPSASAGASRQPEFYAAGSYSRMVKPWSGRLLLFSGFNAFVVAALGDGHKASHGLQTAWLQSRQLLFAFMRPLITDTLVQLINGFA